VKSMRLLRFSLLASCVLFAGMSFAQKDEWLPITSQDLQIKTVPFNPGASAMQLYYNDYRNDPGCTELVYHRIKILNDAGKSYADVEIPLEPQTSMSGLKARTVHPDGSIVEFNGRVFDKTLFKHRGLKIQAKVFTFPAVTVGSIIEYRYRLTWQEGYVYNSAWVLNHKLFTLKENFGIKPYRGAIDTKDGIGGAFGYVLRNMTTAEIPEQHGDIWQMEMENVPGVQDEDFTPTDDAYRPIVLFYYGGREILTPDAFWKNVGTSLTSRVERFIGNVNEVKEIAASTVGNETDPDKKLRKLYARAQEIRNISFESARSQEEIKKEGLKANSHAADVLKHGYGVHEEIDRLFVALARAIGIEAFILQTPDRSKTSFSDKVLITQQLNSEIVEAIVNGKPVFLDPGTRFCPYGLLRWKFSGVPGMKLSKGTTTFIDIPAPLPDDAVLERTTDATLDASGSLKATLKVEFKGEEALERRIDALSSDDFGRKKQLEDEVTSWLPSGATVKLKNASRWTDADQSLIADFDIEVPSFAAVTGKRLVAPAFFFTSEQTKLFDTDFRVNPIAFPYSYTEIDNLSVTLPQGFTMEQPPHERKARLYYASYDMLNSLAENHLKMRRKLSFNGIYFQSNDYFDMKSFFKVVKAGDAGQAILLRQGAEPAAE
jgi:hypothetical protein